MKPYLSLGALAVLSLAVTGCAGEGRRPAEQRDVVTALHERGLFPERRGSAAGVLGVRSAVYRISGGELHIFPFSSARLARAAAAEIGRDGYTIVTKGRAVHVDWLAPPHWFRAGDQLVLYLGTNRRILTALAAIAAPQFAGS